MDWSALLLAVGAGLGSGFVAVVGVLGGRRLTRSQASSFDAAAVKTLAEAEDLRLNTATKAAEFIGQLAASYHSLEGDHARTQREMALLRDYAREHRRWDERVIGLLHQMGEALQKGGLTDDLPDPGQPPPLAPEPADGHRDHQHASKHDSQ